VATTPAGQSGSLVKNYLGYEWDESPSTGYYGNFRPAGLIHLSLTTLSVNTYLLETPTTIQIPKTRTPLRPTRTSNRRWLTS
jgi:hypothetical protein